MPAEKIKLGFPGRDEEIENYKAAIEALARVGDSDDLLQLHGRPRLVPHPRRTCRERGGALTSEFDNRDAQTQGLTQWGEVSEEKVWTTSSTS